MIYLQFLFFDFSEDLSNKYEELQKFCAWYEEKIAHQMVITAN
jgi:hypothetical protein